MLQTAMEYRNHDALELALAAQNIIKLRGLLLLGKTPSVVSSHCGLIVTV